MSTPLGKTDGALRAGELGQQYDDVDHPLWMWDRTLDAGIYFEVDAIGNVRRLRGGARYGVGAALPSDLGGYKFSAFGKTIAADAGTPAPVVDGSGFEQPLRWQGRWYSELAGGVYDVRNRQWSPEVGAFLSPDQFDAYWPLDVTSNGLFKQENVAWRVGGAGTLWGWPMTNPLSVRDASGNQWCERALYVTGGVGVVGGLGLIVAAPAFGKFSPFFTGGGLVTVGGGVALVLRAGDICNHPRRPRLSKRPYPT